MSQQIFTIPLANIPQSFTISLANTEYIMTVRWNDQMSTWLIDFQDSTTNDYIIVGIPLITGADLLAQYAYLGFEGQLFVYTDGDESAPPTLDNLGIESNLYFITDVASQ